MSSTRFRIVREGRLSAIGLALLVACGPNDRSPQDIAKSNAAASKDVASIGSRAWWTDATFVPADTLLNGLRVSTIDSAWSRASILTFAMLPGAARDELSLLADTSTAGFSRDDDFDADGVVDRALTGVFLTRAGETGRFLLILSPAAGPSPAVTFKSTTQPGAGFSVLTFSRGRLEWSTCMECDDILELRWIDGRYTLAYVGPSEETDPDSVPAPPNDGW